MQVEKYSIIRIHDVNFRGQHIRVSWCKDCDFNRRIPQSVELVGHLWHSHNTGRFPVHSWGIWYAGRLFRHYGFSVSFMSVSSTSYETSKTRESEYDCLQWKFRGTVHQLWSQGVTLAVMNGDGNNGAIFAVPLPLPVPFPFAKNDFLNVVCHGLYCNWQKWMQGETPPLSRHQTVTEWRPQLTLMMSWEVWCRSQSKGKGPNRIYNNWTNSVSQQQNENYRYISFPSTGGLKMYYSGRQEELGYKNKKGRPCCERLRAKVGGYQN